MASHTQVIRTFRFSKFLISLIAMDIDTDFPEYFLNIYVFILVMCVGV